MRSSLGIDAGEVRYAKRRRDPGAAGWLSSPSARHPADEASMKALDAHLATYLCLMPRRRAELSGGRRRSGGALERLIPLPFRSSMGEGARPGSRFPWGASSASNNGYNA